MQALLEEVLAAGRERAPSGEVAHYIPELARVDPALVALVAQPLDGEAAAVGDCDQPFTLQSVSKPFALACVQAAGVDPYTRMTAEPSGDAFHSIMRLEEERGRPRNPLINAGAIAVSGLLPGATANEKIAGFLAFLGRCGAPGGVIDDAVYQSERRTGYRNRALANYMKHFGILDDPELAVDAYFRQCATRVTARSLARIGLFLANDGCDPLSGERVVDAATCRRLLAVMSTCGLYDEVGRFALEVGLPAKSGVSGAILAIVPGRMSLVAYGPALGPRGNSVAGMCMLRLLSERLDLSLYSASRSGDSR